MLSPSEYSTRRARLWFAITLACFVYLFVVASVAAAISREYSAIATVAIGPVFGVMIVILIRLADRRYMRADRERVLRAGCNVCVECGFDLSGHEPDMPCSECGAAGTTSERVARWSKVLGVAPGINP